MKISTKISIILLSFVFLGFFSAQAFGEEMSAEQKQVWKAQKATWELMEKGEKDIEKYKANFHKDLFYLGRTSVSPANRNRWAMLLINYMTVDSFELKPIEIKIFGNIAIVMYSYNFKNSMDMITSGKVTNIFMKEDGKWLLLSGMSSSCQKPSMCP